MSRAEEDSAAPLGQGSLGLRQRIFRSVTWNVVGTSLSQVSVLITSVLTARLLGPHIFGEFTMLQNTGLAFGGLAQLATGITATRYVAEYRSTDPPRAGRVIGACSTVTLFAGLFGCLAVLLLSDWLSIEVLKAPHLSSGLRLMALYVLLFAVSGYQVGTLAGLDAYRLVARIGAVHAVIHIVVCATAVLLFGLWGALAGLVLSLAARWRLYEVAIRKESAAQGIHICASLPREERLALIGFALPATLVGLTYAPSLWLAGTMLAKQEGGYVELGIYSVAFTFKTMLMFLPYTINSVGASFLSNLSSSDRRDQFKRVFIGNLSAVAGSALAGGLLIVVFGEWLIALFGSKFAAAMTVIPVLAAAAVAESIMLALYLFLQTRGRMWTLLFFVTLPRDVAFPLCAMALVSNGRAVGLAWAYLFSIVLSMLAVAFLTGREWEKPDPQPMS